MNYNARLARMENAVKNLRVATNTGDVTLSFDELKPGQTHAERINNLKQALASLRISGTINVAGSSSDGFIAG